MRQVGEQDTQIGARYHRERRFALISYPEIYNTVFKGL